ncbi:Heavy metal transport/detoxification protein [Thermobaculum terrenum ATCC BAA-798]|uniref:Heavy metal transport/detoxification protein n=1 Tax=Thermobaculum terrenum (strain ATCC BAA-798 / CCMEE 7001 / YNP1) TaxID=525904 RepID=D1CF03_THET1|nr:heavy metal-associated domain-containing protein [Thermobaculum terrenum]ACZ41509.1 Heavy metal transport/detoxification protein [Thermobaculum terrenum ATCC BAA-798]
MASTLDLVSFNVPGMTQDSDRSAVYSSLDGVPGIEEVVINLPARLVQVKYDPEEVSPEEIKALIESTGLMVQRYSNGYR